MNCPSCKIEAIIERVQEENGTLMREYICRNPKCAMFQKLVGEETIALTEDGE